MRRVKVFFQDQEAGILEEHSTNLYKFIYDSDYRGDPISLTILIGNEDMHLKNFSLIRRDFKVELTPAYDLVNTTIAIGNPTEEIALTLKGKKNNLTRALLIDYYGVERLKLTDKTISEVLSIFEGAFNIWDKLIENSFLSKEQQEKYRSIVRKRHRLIFKTV